VINCDVLFCVFVCLFEVRAFCTSLREPRHIVLASGRLYNQQLRDARVLKPQHTQDHQQWQLASEQDETFTRTSV
jgi:hypothetical protein